jgi:uncharacterized protein (TIGR00251 family)
MQTPEGAITAVVGGVQIQVKAVPGASRDQIVGWLGDHLKIAVAAPPEAGKANKAVCRLLADALGIRTSDVQIAAGFTAPRKRLLIKGLSAEDVRERLRNR